MIKFKLALLCNALAIFWLQNVSAQEIILPDPLMQAPSQAIGFVENKGQVQTTDHELIPGVLFHSVRTQPKNYFFNNQLSFVYAKVDATEPELNKLRRIDLVWGGKDRLNSTPSSYEAKDEVINYYLPQCPTGCDQLPVYNRLVYKDIYPNIDMHVYSNEAWIKYYFVVNPGGDPKLIQLVFSGHDKITVNSDIVTLEVEDAVMRIPSGVVYQVNSTNQISTVGWTNKFSSPVTDVVTFTTGTYDNTQKLVYELSAPVSNLGKAKIGNLSWATPMGNEFGAFWDVATNTSGEPYVTGYSFDQNFPLSNAYQGSNAGSSDATVLKFGTDARLIWSTYLGGNDEDGSLARHGIAVNNDNNPFIMFSSWSNNIPTKTPSAGAFYNSTTSGPGSLPSDYYIAKFSPAGQLLWGTWFDWGNIASASDITVDASGNIFAVGAQNAHYMDFVNPGSPAYYNQPVLDPFNYNQFTPFLVKFTPSLALNWSTAIEGNAYSVEIDNSQRIVIGGGAFENMTLQSPNSGAYQQSYVGGTISGEGDAFISRFNTNLSLNWQTYFGGNAQDVFSRIAIAPDNSIFAAGHGSSTDMPLAGSSLQASFQGGDQDGIIAKFDANSSLIYATYQGGNRVDDIQAISTTFNDVFVAGGSMSDETTFPLLSGQPSTLYTDLVSGYVSGYAYNEATIAGYDKTMTPEWTTYFSSSVWNDMIYGSDFYAGNYYVVGITNINNSFPGVDPGSPAFYQPAASSSGYTGFIARFDMTGTPMGVNDVRKQASTDYKLYPNPAKDVLTILSANKRISNVKIIDLKGSVVKNVQTGLTNNITILTNDLETGMYLAEVIDGNTNEVTRIKFIVE